ncbi:MAG: tRNA (adenosine(37)-N6)-threonylcarbamoyltransferase complex ATPase subunit type 1 TsaE [Flavobacteriaceae bacterium]|nr:tRNA (adenosine(37)-N6)-threonylcarbamoyltransferase complex ATPase subunit type 1 TsaE [Flavobacteriaceae bacterium]
MRITYTLEELPEVTGKVLLEVSTKTLLFYGEMGVGKTTFINTLAQQLGVKEALSSPTFSIVNEYELKGDKLFHFDCYRLKNEEEALDIGIEDYLDTNHWCFVEWPERIESLLPDTSTKIALTKNQNGSRTVYIENCL